MSATRRLGASLAAAWPAALLLVALFAGCRERGRPDPAIRMAVSHEQEQNADASSPAQGRGAEQSGENAPKVPDRLDVPDAVKAAYSGIVLVWRDSQSNKEGKLQVPLGGSAPLPGSDLVVGADVFLPSFTMTNEAITSAGVEQENPAARIRVAEGGKEIFGGWIFQRFPDVHPFTHPRFSLHLDGGVRKSGK